VRIRNGTVELHVASDGDPAAPPILLLHGITSHGRTWDWIVPELAERFRVLRLDFRGHGLSDRAPGSYTPDGYLGDAVAVCEQLAGQPCIVIGHSLGGAIAGAMAQSRPELLRTAVMEDPPLGVAGNRPGRTDRTLLDSFAMMRRSIPRIQGTEMTEGALAELLTVAPGSSGASFGATLHPDGIAAMAGSMLALDATVLDPILEGGFGPLLDPDAPFGVPTLIVCADPEVPGTVADPDVSRRFSDRSPGSAVSVIAGAGHLIHDEKASRNRFRDAVVSFVDGVVASPR